MIKFIFQFIFILFSYTVVAQYSIGSKIGMASTSNDEEYIVGTELSNETNYGLNIGLSFTKMFDGFGIRVEPMFINLGGEHIITAYDVEFKLKQTRNYLRTNLLFESHTSLDKKTKLFVYFGPSFSVLLKAERIKTVDEYFMVMDYGDISYFDFGLTIGTGIGVKLGNGWLELDVRANISGPYLDIPIEWGSHWYFNGNSAINICYAMIIKSK